MEALSLPSNGSAANPQQRPSSPDGNDENDLSQKKGPVRKRTKTGCLTCRKRRIKCDEGKPTCNNCLRSKRQCEGYNQRVIFKDPLGAIAGAPYGPIQYPAPSPQALVREQQLSVAQQRSSSQSLQIIAPKPPAVGYHPLAAHQFSHFYPSHVNPVPPQPPVNLAPNQFLSQPQPSKYTFFPPTTIDAFSQGHGRQDIPGGNNRYPPQAPQSSGSEGQASTSPQSRKQLNGSGTFVGVEPTVPVSEEQLEDWDYEFYDDDASLAESDDEFLPANLDSQGGLDGPGVVTSQRLDHQYHMLGTNTRTFSTFGAETVLATYDPSPGNSPLNDKHIAAVFWHFINVTGPSMSIYERHPLDPSNVFQGQMPTSKQHGWTYAYPVMSFSHPALLQAMLALASLQIAKLQKIPPTASLKHYHLALRRVAKNVMRPARRTQTANLAATLILAFYEVWNSDHDKWCSHMLGAKWIIKEIPLSEMTRAIMAIKMQKRQTEMELGILGDCSSTDDSDFLYRDWDLIDVSLLSTIMGREVSCDDLGMLPEELSAHPRPKYIYTNKDMERYEQLSDLFWWYCKMDVYQSILGGTRPFLEYNTWMQCPPRSPIGRLDAIYGTYDHLILLLGRLVNFVSRDLSRKRAALERSGSSGPRPPPGMFSGMMPASEKVTPPMGFTPPPEDSSSPPRTTSRYRTADDLDTRTVEAVREWEQIALAFDEIRKHFGPDFEPLGADIYPSQPTPFGPATHYRTYSIAGIWMNYYMGLIVLHRAHPKMPPVAMLAAGMSANTTMPWAFKLSRIAAGLEENITRLTVVSTLMGGALIESAFPLFVVGVQLQDEAQRHWLIRRLRDIARLTGWQSAHQIADGCESAWSKAAQLGRGPPYRPPPDPGFEEDAKEVRDRHKAKGRQAPSLRPDVAPPGMSWVWGNPRRLDRRILEEDGTAIGSARDGMATDNKKIVLAKGEKAFYAMGLLSVEQDFEKLDLDSGDREK
ncbi:hypothetical protein F5B22DRAFT_260157 [Xylaria bambusicola]|uniref:uncharacterized protein n=1 Tax=Xylaria bambusicola TaxID=326684 RepID=UPI002007A9BD|nr:uncharacterized protein F5B22DRAFT_260157 [Xylaria bambusicola]KAI0525919.1 hypothetical protein F5B22DRAFT_260157 [Xylaria bambusicola]